MTDPKEFRLHRYVRKHSLIKAIRINEDNIQFCATIARGSVKEGIEGPYIYLSDSSQAKLDDWLFFTDKGQACFASDTWFKDNFRRTGIRAE